MAGKKTMRYDFNLRKIPRVDTLNHENSGAHHIFCKLVFPQDVSFPRSCGARGPHSHLPGLAICILPCSTQITKEKIWLLQNKEMGM